MSTLSEDYEIIEKTPFSFSDALDPESEETLIKEFVNFGMSDDNWKIYENTDKIKVDYKVSKKENIYTIRSETVISNADIEEYYKFCESNNQYHKYLSSFLGDENTEFVKNIDKDHNVLYSSVQPGYINSHFIAPRDFCYVQTRFSFEDYSIQITDINDKDEEEKEDETIDYICGSYCYSNCNHPYYVNDNKIKNSVRGSLVRAGYILAQLDYDSFRAINVFCCEWNGKLPHWYLNNFVMSYDGAKIKEFHHNWFNTVSKSVEERRNAEENEEEQNEVDV
mmetsp:Transcript_28842/g.25476  ORF Transcript_28842/g.25476 Transcript_28842/m.25476 type:complete len:280 (-) Transcript_28842:110-949(-)